MIRGFREEGIVLRSVDSGEADKFLTILTKDRGLCDFLAKGARKINSKKAPHLDLFNYVSLYATGKEAPYYIVQAESQCDFRALKLDFEKVQHSYTFSEIILAITPKEVEDRSLFASTHNYFQKLQNGTSHAGLNRKFALFLLKHGGFPSPENTNHTKISSYFEHLIGRKIISLSLAK